MFIAGNETTNSLIRTEFPELNYLPLKGYNIQYSTKKWLLPFKIIQQIPSTILLMKFENKWLKRVAEQHKIDLIFSDNRYGLYHDLIPCYFITHQLQIQVPQSYLLQKLVNYMNHAYIRKFTTCLVPDYEELKMSGTLSQKGNLKHVSYIGNLSRFEYNKETKLKYDLLILLSGPEPQRTVLEQLFISELTGSDLNALIVRGKPDDLTSPISNGKIELIHHLNAHDLQQAILSSRMVICRAGYSSIMDLIKLRKHAILIPTPGQTEQEYLGVYLMHHKWFISFGQQETSLQHMLKLYHEFSFNEFPDWDMELYKSVFEQLINEAI